MENGTDNTAGSDCLAALGSPIGFLSCVQWPDGLLSFAYEDHGNTTRDRHDTREQAEAVCKMIEREGLGGERCHFPVKTWVEEILPENK